MLVEHDDDPIGERDERRLRIGERALELTTREPHVSDAARAFAQPTVRPDHELVAHALHPDAAIPPAARVGKSVASSAADAASRSPRPYVASA